MNLKEKLANAKTAIQKNQKKVILIVCSVVIIGGLITTTLAWLTSKTGPVINNFIGSDLEIDLTETPPRVNSETSEPEYVYQMIPGQTIDKNPQVTVKANSEACWLFLQVKESDAQANGSGLTRTQNGQSVERINKDDDLYKYLRYQVLPATTNDHTGEGWNLMSSAQAEAAGFPLMDEDHSVNTYYYRQVGADGTAISTDITYDILTTLEQDGGVKNKIIVNEYIINDELTSSQLSTKPVKITFTPAAVQRLGFGFEDAGKEVSQFFK